MTLGAVTRTGAAGARAAAEGGEGDIEDGEGEGAGAGGEGDAGDAGDAGAGSRRRPDGTALNNKHPCNPKPVCCSISSAFLLRAAGGRIQKEMSYVCHMSGIMTRRPRSLLPHFSVGVPPSPLPPTLQAN